MDGEKRMNGKEAKLAWANGEDIEYSAEHIDWSDLEKNNTLAVFDNINLKFRLKPKTININGIEVPAPFEPEYGDDVWFINDDNKNGYGCVSGYDDEFSFMGYWKTEEEIKQVVSALRSIFKKGL